MGICKLVQPCNPTDDCDPREGCGFESAVGSLFGLDKPKSGPVNSRSGAEGFLRPLSLRRRGQDSKVCQPTLGRRGTWQFSVASSSHEPFLHPQIYINAHFRRRLRVPLGGALDGDALLLRTAGTWSHSSNPRGKVLQVSLDESDDAALIRAGVPQDPTHLSGRISHGLIAGGRVVESHLGKAGNCDRPL